MDCWKVRNGEEKDQKGILSLRKTVFAEMEKDKLDPRFWKWEFSDCPEGKGLIYLVEDGNKIIGHFADLPRRFSIYGKIVHGTLSVDLMVSPDFRRRGIFEAMGRYAVERTKKEGFYFTSAFPIRKETIQGFKKIGWKEIVKLPVLVYPIKFSGIVNRYLRIHSLSLLIGGVAGVFHTLLLAWRKKRIATNILIEKVVQLDDTFNCFLERTSSLYEVVGMRDRDYMSWRYLRHPTRTYTIYRAMDKGEMKGFIILRTVDLLGFRTAVIVDFMTFDEDAFASLVDTGTAYGREEGVDLLGIMLSPLHPYYSVLKRYGFLRSPKTFRFMIYPLSEDRHLLDPKAWFVTWGDTDVI